MLTTNQSTFLAAFAESGHVRSAAETAEIHPSTHYRWLTAGGEYADQFNEARLEAADRLEFEARRRAVDGIRRYKFNRNGEPLLHPVTGEPYYELSYSDTLLMFLLKANAPEKFGDRVESNVTNASQSKVTIYLPDNGRESA